MMSIISGVRRPKRSARIPKRSAPTGRNINVSVMVNAMAERATLKSFAIRSVTNVRMKKSKASSVQPRKLARKALRCSRLSDPIKANTFMDYHPLYAIPKTAIYCSHALQGGFTYPVLSGAFGKGVDENQSRSIGSVHDQSAPTGFPAMSECSTKSATLLLRRRSSRRSNNRDNRQHDIGGALTIMQKGLVSDS